MRSIFWIVVSASVVAGWDNRPICIEIIGREGMTGLSVILGNGRNANEIVMEVAGSGQCIQVADLLTAIDNSPSLHRSLLRYAGRFLDEVALTAAANGRANIAERLARCLLMVGDRLGGTELPLTHEFLPPCFAFAAPACQSPCRSWNAWV